MSTTSRPMRFPLCLSADERRMLDRLAEDVGVDKADVLRAGLRAQHEARFGRGADPVTQSK